MVVGNNQSARSHIEVRKWENIYNSLAQYKKKYSKTIFIDIPNWNWVQWDCGIGEKSWYKH